MIGKSGDRKPQRSQSAQREKAVGWVRKAARFRSFGSRQTSPLAHDDSLRRGGFPPHQAKRTGSSGAPVLRRVA